MRSTLPLYLIAVRCKMVWMEAGSDVKFYNSKKDYLSKRSLKKLEKPIVDKIQTKEKVDISEKAKDLKKAPEKIEAKLKEAGKIGNELLGQAADVLTKSITSSVQPSIPSISSNSEVKELVVDQSKKLVDTPGIFFVKGLSVNPFATDNLGLTGMSKNIPTAEVFDWNEESELLDAIKSRPHSQPLLLIGHGVGGDTAVNVTNVLNSVENGFRRVDLLVTLDSIGFDNDIIPQNVRENMNMISDKDTFFNDGPNIARNKGLTKVSNELRTESHSELDESAEVQFQIYEKINHVLNRAVLKRKNFDKLHNAYKVMVDNRKI